MYTKSMKTMQSEDAQRLLELRDRVSKKSLDRPKIQAWVELLKQMPDAPSTSPKEEVSTLEIYEIIAEKLLRDSL